ncbi:MAG: hypothetical protein BZ138_00600 [Methanosphaera sp. rholeuAM270]|nr:MAG: hypothetical protein BZ138_00600 [Methanosphaera sp. rholeuAM270]
MSFEEKKEEISKKIDETQANIAASTSEKIITAQMNKAEKKVDKAIEEADKNICKLLENTDKEIESGDRPVDLILFKANNQFEEIRLEAELKMQKAKVELIKSLEKDVEKFEHLANIESNTSEVKDKICEEKCKIKDKIECRKSEIKEKLNQEE